MVNEGEICQKMSMAAKEIRAHAVENNICTTEDANKIINGDWSGGYKFLKVPDQRPKMFFQKIRGTRVEFVEVEGASEAVPDFNFSELIGR